MENKRKTQLDSIQVMRGIGAILIVLFHCTQLYQTKFHINYLHGLFGFGYIGVDLFFVISGFILFYIHEKQIGKKEGVIKYLVNRILRIYPLYWIILLIVIALMFIVPSAGDSNKYNIVFVLSNFLLIPNKVKLFMIPPVWTLTYEMLFYIIFASAILTNRKIFKIILCIWASLCLINIIGIIDNNNVYLKVIFDPINTEFIMGAIIYYLIKKYKDKFSKSICNICLLLGTILITVFGLRIYFHKPYGNRVFIGLSIALIVFSIILINIKNRSKYNKLLVKIGNASYSIYLTHFTLLSASIIVLQKIHFKYLNTLTITLFNIIVIVLGYICYNILEKPLGKKIKRLNIKKDVQSDITYSRQALSKKES